MGAPTVTYLLLHGCIVAPPGPITSIHIQKEQSRTPPWGTDAKPKKSRFLLSALVCLRTLGCQLWKLTLLRLMVELCAHFWSPKWL